MCHPEKRALALLALLMSLCGSVHAQPPSDFEAALLDALRADLLSRWKDTHLYTPAARRAALCTEFFGPVERDKCQEWHNDKTQAEQRLAQGIAALGLQARVHATRQLVMQLPAGAESHEQALQRDPVYALLYEVGDGLTDGHGGSELAQCGKGDPCVIVFEFDHAGVLRSVRGELAR